MNTQFFSDIYLKFTHLYAQNMVQEEDEPRVPEKVIRCVWNDQLLNTEDLRTTDGKPLEVVFPGYWNFGSGPDFKSAAIKVDGVLLEGDVELHVYGTDWKSHGHSRNNDFDNVILHVFLWKGRGKAATGKRLSRPHIFDLELKSYLRRGVLQLNEELDFDNYPVLNPFNYGLCHGPLARLTEVKFLELLNAAGDARIQTKMDRFHDRIITHGYEQTFYEGVAEAMGYPSNKTAFKTLAEKLPLATLKAHVPARASAQDKALVMQALLFGVSGLIDFAALKTSTLSAAAKTYFSQLEKIWKKHEAELGHLRLERKDWKFGRMRPANFPYRRIAGLSHLVVRHWQNGIFGDYLNSIKSIVSKDEEKAYTAASLKKTVQFFCLEVDDHWASHYTPGGKKLKKKQKLVGADRSREITINIGIPIGLIYARASKSVPLERALGRLFHTKSAPADNQWLRFMKHYILGNKDRMWKLLKSDQQTQGLMQVYQDYCTKNENNCLRCQFPKVVDQYFS